MDGSVVLSAEAPGDYCDTNTAKEDQSVEGNIATEKTRNSAGDAHEEQDYGNERDSVASSTRDEIDDHGAYRRTDIA